MQGYNYQWTRLALFPSAYILGCYLYLPSFLHHKGSIKYTKASIYFCKGSWRSRRYMRPSPTLLQNEWMWALPYMSELTANTNGKAWSWRLVRGRWKSYSPQRRHCSDKPTTTNMATRTVVVGATGFIGRFVAEPSLATGGATYVLLRPVSPRCPAKTKTIRALQDQGAAIVHVLVL